jgi:hypothetical protein
MQQARFTALALALLFALQGGGQQRPDFSGVWQMDRSRSESAHQGVPIGPVTLVIKQNPAQVSIETRSAQKGKGPISSETLTFKLDGSESSITSGSGAKIQTKAHWDENRLVAETSRDIHGSTVTTMHVLSLDTSGKELTIDKTLTVQHGYQFQGANSKGSGKDVFIRSKGSSKK